jgi:hypothetical protein
MRPIETILDLGDKDKVKESLKEMIELLEYYENLHPTGRAAHWLAKKDEKRGLTCR